MYDTSLSKKKEAPRKSELMRGASFLPKTAHRR